MKVFQGQLNIGFLMNIWPESDFSHTTFTLEQQQYWSEIRKDLWAESYTQVQRRGKSGGVMDVEHMAAGTRILHLILRISNITKRVSIHGFGNQ